MSRLLAHGDRRKPMSTMIHDQYERRSDEWRPHGSLVQMPGPPSVGVIESRYSLAVGTYGQVVIAR